MIKSVLIFLVGYALGTYFQWSYQYAMEHEQEWYPLPDGRPGCWHSTELRTRVK